LSQRDIRCQGAILRGGEILLIRHRHHDDGRAYWLIPGGGQEPDESEPECVRREMLEETGLEVQVGGLLVDGAFPPGGYYNRFHTYHCTVLRGEPRPGYEPEPDAAAAYAIVAVAWFDLNDEAGWGEEIVSDPYTYPELKHLQGLGVCGAE
jgi:8-oxo-dGTP diphosphatase